MLRWPALTTPGREQYTRPQLPTAMEIASRGCGGGEGSFHRWRDMGILTLPHPFWHQELPSIGQWWDGRDIR